MYSAKAITPIPVYLISGFLGSGKTTLLNHLLQQWPKSAVIINEFGSTPIDQQLLRKHNVPLSTLAGGCLCCQVIGALTPLLKNLRLAWEQNPNAFARVIIESSGVANPEPILDIILRERWLAKRYSLQAVLTTVSASNGLTQLQRFPAAQAQIAWADILLQTQTDLASDSSLAQLQAQLQSLNPTAKRLIAPHGQIAVHDLQLARLPFRAIPPSNPDTTAHNFSTSSLQLAQPIDIARVQHAVSSLVQQHAAQIVRIKGIVFSPDAHEPWLIQAGTGHCYPAVPLPHRASDDGIGRLVLITTEPSVDYAAALQHLIAQTA